MFVHVLYMCMQHTVILSSLCKWKRPKWLILLLNGTHLVGIYARPKIGGTHTQGQNRAVRITQGGCHPHKVATEHKYNIRYNTLQQKHMST